MSRFESDVASYNLEDRCIVHWKDGSMYAGHVRKVLDPRREILIDGVPTRRNGKQEMIEDITPFKKLRNDRSKRVPVSVLDQCSQSGQKWFYVHYFGWKTNFDEWLPQHRMMPYTPRNISEMKSVNAEIKERAKRKKEEEAREKDKKHRKRDQSPKPEETLSRSRRSFNSKGASEDSDSAAGSKRPTSTANGTHSKSSLPGSKRRRIVLDDGPGVEIRLSVPLALKRMLVSDWQLVTRDREIVQLPRQICVVEILKDFAQSKTGHLAATSGERENMDQFVKSMITYFDHSLGMMLLYRFERNQYYLHQKKANFRASLVYGAEHLARLIVSMPALLSQLSEMDDKTMDYIVKQLEQLSVYLTDHRIRYFAGPDTYDSATRAYEVLSVPNMISETIVQPEQVKSVSESDDDS